MYGTYKEELYSLIAGLTDGEAETIVRSVVDRGLMQDGFKALIDLNNRFDRRTAASLLSALLKVISPPHIGNYKDVITATANWEARVAALKSEHGEEIGEKVKMAIFMNMLPKDLQDMILQNGAMMTEAMTFEVCRDQVISVVTQRMHLRNPNPDAMDVGEVAKDEVGSDADVDSGAEEPMVDEMMREQLPDFEGDGGVLDGEGGLWEQATALERLSAAGPAVAAADVVVIQFFQLFGSSHALDPPQPPQLDTQTRAVGTSDRT